MNVYDQYDRKRLWDAMASSRDRLRKSRGDRLDGIKQLVGKNYGDNGADESVPVPFIELATSTYTQLLVGNAPRAYTTSLDPELRPAAADLKIALDETSDRIDLEDTLRRIVQDAMFCVGLVKIGTGRPGENSWWNGTAEPFVEWIDLDDWVHDCTAKTWESIAFAGNRYRLPLEDVKEDQSFDAKVRKKLKATRKSTTTEEGDEKAESISGGLAVESDEYEDEVELWDIWLPREQLLVTFAADDDLSEPLRVVRWKGPRSGPYMMLGFETVPSNIMPLPPVALWKDLHDLANFLYLKLGRQAKNQKTVLPVRGGDEGDVQRLNDAPDGHAYLCNGEPGKETSYGGPSQINLAFWLANNELANRHAGNLDVLGGLSASADTLGQEQMMGENASQRIVAMRRCVAKFVDQIFTHLAHYLYQDPTVELPLVKTVANTDVRIPIKWSAGTRVGKPSLFKIQIEPYSMTYRTPQSQVNSLMQVWREVVMAVAPLLPPANIVAATEALLKTLADKMNLPELQDLLPYLVAGVGNADEPVNQGQSMQPSPMPATTTRRYVRQNIPGASRSQKDNALAQALLGSMPQPSEAAAMMRGTS